MAETSLFMLGASPEHPYRAGIVRDQLLQRVVDELHLRAPDIEVSVPEGEPDVRRLDKLGVIWVEE